jgi:hypothetical protein
MSDRDETPPATACHWLRTLVRHRAAVPGRVGVGRQVQEAPCGSEAGNGSRTPTVVPAALGVRAAAGWRWGPS